MQSVAFRELGEPVDVNVDLLWSIVSRPLLDFLNEVLRVAIRSLPVVLVEVVVILLC